MQRLFSMFPKGLPGLALLLLRVGLGLMVIDTQWAQHGVWIAVVVGTSLALGLLTPMTCLLGVLLGLLQLMLPAIQSPQPLLCIILDSVALGLLGPGGYSLDCILFGRKRIVFPPE